MAHHFNDNIYTKSFTPREYQIELLDAAKDRNIICCLATSSGKVFIATKLVQELANSARRPFKNGGKRTFYLADSPSSVALQASYVRHLTDLSVGEYNTKQLDSLTQEDWRQELVDHQVLVMTSDVCLSLLQMGFVNISSMNLMVLDECHHASKSHTLRDIISEFYVPSKCRPRLLGLTAPLLNSSCEPSRLEAEIRRLEDALHSEAETASDIVSILRYCNKPREIVVECGLAVSGELDAVVENEIRLVKAFLDDHRYDPSAEYDEAYIDELDVVPDPKIDPYRVIEEFLEVLHTLGPFCADRAAFVLLTQLEKLKVKIPYERHFLLLCMVSSVFVKIRAIFDQAFEQCSENERIFKYSSPKILRLLEVLRQFKPPKSPDVVETDAKSDNPVDSDSPGRRQASCEISRLTTERTEIEISQNHNSSCEPNQHTVIDNKSKQQIVENNCNANLNMESNTDSKLKLNGIVGPATVRESETCVTETKQEAARPEEARPVLTTGFVPRSRFVKYRRGMPGNEGTGPGRPGGRSDVGHRSRNFLSEDANALCGIVFVRKAFTAKILYQVLSEVRRHDEDLAFLSTQFTVDKTADPVTECRESEAEHRNQEEVLKRFRIRECNLLVATSVLEQGIDVPKCNLVVRFDLPPGYRSYVQSKGRAKAADAHYVLMTERSATAAFVGDLAQYMEIEQLLLRKCANREPLEEEEKEADKLTDAVVSYRPKDSPTNASVNMSNAVALVNRYCAKLPSDTFTRLTPQWQMSVLRSAGGEPAFTCSVRLPINSPLKRGVGGPAMPTRVLARRAAALQVCRALHAARELDDNLLPVGKESFRLHDTDDLGLDEVDLAISRDVNEPRPGTTKRRQYYYKRVAASLTDCRPLASQPAHLYLITMVLTCPLPEEQNTRGRRIYPPEESPQGFGILTRGAIPKICPFPIFTRSGEVSVRLELADCRVRLDDDKVEKIVTFLNYTFTSVLRLQKYLMMFDPQASENSYFVVPTRRDADGGGSSVDWDFLDRIYADHDFRPHMIPEAERAAFAFAPPAYDDAVIMPWYRNQDQPQYFYVAEICSQLSPKSKFPGQEYDTFDEYYATKYGIRIQNAGQPLLDVDHTSARLNFLTPRYVNRKGVALPTSSEETKRAKRENLEQKQILVPELCTVHPFPASLWRKAVCLPCILYRINALLLADEVRMQVARDIALGQVSLPDDFEWAPLDFGWSLADVLLKSKGNAKVEPAHKLEPKEKENDDDGELPNDKGCIENAEAAGGGDKGEESDSDWMEIGTWSNEMAVEAGLDLATLPGISGDDSEVNGINAGWIAPPGGNRYRYGSPSSWVGGYGGIEQDLEGFETDDSSDADYLDKSDSSDGGGLRIHFKGNNEAEAVEDEVETEKRQRRLMLCDAAPAPESRWELDDTDDADDPSAAACVSAFHAAAAANRAAIAANGMLIPADQPVVITRNPRKNVFNETPSENASDAVVDDNDLVTVDGLAYHAKKLMPLVVDPGMGNGEEGGEAEPIEGYPEVEIAMEEDIIDQFSFDLQPDLAEHSGPSPSLILQALTMSNANDGINLERLETIGDSFLKYAITTYLYCTYENIHEGKLSHLRSKQVSNLNLYRLGRRKIFGESMIATKFEPHDNWLPPCYYVPRELEQALIEAGVPASHWNQADLPALRELSREQICTLVRERGLRLLDDGKTAAAADVEALPCFIPYNLITQHSIPDKSIADCVEALIGAYLIATGPRGALLFMAWLGICVLPREEAGGGEGAARPVGSTIAVGADVADRLVCYGQLKAPTSPLLRHVAEPERELRRLLDGYDVFERRIAYRFRDRSYLLQSMTHASYAPNRLTDCYQRLEFLGDAVLDYLITRHLYEDQRQHSPGALTDLRSALVNNTIFASLAVRFGFHKFFRHLSPGLNDVVDRFVRIQEENGHTISEEYYLIEEEECEEAEDVEVPKALGDVFESVAGAIFLDSGMSLDAVWRVYYRMMKPEIEQFSTNVPKSPIRDLLELEPETAKFGKPEKLADGRRVRVTVEVFGKGVFKGIGRNYRIAKCTAAKCALKALKKKGMLSKK